MNLRILVKLCKFSNKQVMQHTGEILFTLCLLIAFVY